MKLNSLVHQFFDHYLPHIKGVSHYTIKAYRDTFKLFLPFAAKHYGIKIRSLRVEHISSQLILSFLDDLQKERKNLARTRNHRLAALKSFSKMIRFMYPQHRELADTILNIPQKRYQKTLIGFLYHDEILKVFKSVDLRRKEGFRDYTLLHLLFDSGARASEITTLNLDYFNPRQKTLAILGKGDRFRLIDIENKTSELLQVYINRYRGNPKPLYQHRLFISQRAEELTRHGIYRICKKYLTRALPSKRLQYINPVHSFRHSRAVDLLYQGQAITDIKNRLGHDNLQSTTIYLQLDLNRRRHIQRGFIKHMQSVLTDDPKLDELLQWENEKDIMKWLDSL
ncbi:MAG: tyrosine-type recombinase/integrase [Pseudomonadota bacterium]